MKLKNIHQEMQIQVTPDKMWSILSQYGDVSNFHAGVIQSINEIGSENTAALGCERICNIVDLGLHITLKERIVEFIDHKSYKYEVYEWKNFPIQKMLFGFTIQNTDDLSKTILAIDIEYKAKPAILTPLMAGKMKNLARDVLLGYKHYAETGEMRAPIKTLISKYKSQTQGKVQYV